MSMNHVGNHSLDQLRQFVKTLNGSRSYLSDAILANCAWRSCIPGPTHFGRPNFGRLHTIGRTHLVRSFHLPDKDGFDVSRSTCKQSEQKTNETRFRNKSKRYGVKKRSIDTICV